ncbi:MAG: hypothetical protein IPF83_14495 [Rhodanobacteraceae bacterium]|nr:hypothetical protein [Rhodanobacteraceae bacterium]
MKNKILLSAVCLAAALSAKLPVPLELHSLCKILPLRRSAGMWQLLCSIPVMPHQPVNLVPSRLTM